MTEVDRQALHGPFSDYLAAVMRGALRDGIWGWHDDDLAFARGWGFAVDDVAVPVTVWQGREDAMVPYAHGVWLSQHVQGRDREVVRRRGAPLAGAPLRRVVDDLLARAGAP